jgi:integrase
MIHAGATPKAVQAILGHRSATFTLTVYGHLLETDLDELAANLEGLAGYARAEPLKVAAGDARHAR